MSWVIVSFIDEYSYLNWKSHNVYRCVSDHANKLENEYCGIC